MIRCAARIVVATHHAASWWAVAPAGDLRAVDRHHVLRHSLCKLGALDASQFGSQIYLAVSAVPVLSLRQCHCANDPWCGVIDQDEEGVRVMNLVGQSVEQTLAHAEPSAAARQQLARLAGHRGGMDMAVVGIASRV